MPDMMYRRLSCKPESEVKVEKRKQEPTEEELVAEMNRLLDEDPEAFFSMFTREQLGDILRRATAMLFDTSPESLDLPEAKGLLRAHIDHAREKKVEQGMARLESLITRGTEAE
jgi:hypothetical protein